MKKYFVQVTKENYKELMILLTIDDVPYEENIIGGYMEISKHDIFNNISYEELLEKYKDVLLIGRQVSQKKRIFCHYLIEKKPCSPNIAKKAVCFLYKGIEYQYFCFEDGVWIK